MSFYVDATPFVNPSVWANVAPYISEWQGTKPLVERTKFAIEKATPFDFFAPEKGPAAPTAALSAQAGAVDQTQTLNESSAELSTSAFGAQPNADVERMAAQRVQLMAAKYAGGNATAEILARLEILNRRLLERAPRVSEEQVRALEIANDQLVRIRAAREERSARLGLRV